MDRIEPGDRCGRGASGCVGCVVRPDRGFGAVSKLTARLGGRRLYSNRVAAVVEQPLATCVPAALYRVGRRTRPSRGRATARVGALRLALDLARLLAQTGEREATFAALDQALAERSPMLVLLRVDRAWDRVRDDARFAAAVRRIGIP